MDYRTVTCSCGAKAVRPNPLELPTGWHSVQFIQSWILCPRCLARHERDQVAIKAACDKRMADKLKFEKV
jgi:hypothetical protein